MTRSITNPDVDPSTRLSTESQESDTTRAQASSTDQAVTQKPLVPENQSNEPKKFTETQLKRIHRHFGHAAASKLYQLIRRSLNAPPPNTLAELEEIVASCVICKEFSPRPISFRVRTPDHVLFNHYITLDLVWLPARNPPSGRTNKPCLHIVDMGTRFNAATFIQAENTSAIWNAFIRSWCCLYIGFPNHMLVDQGAVFLSDEWKAACELNAIELKTTGTESHNSLSVGETYHAYLRRTYNKVHREHPSVPDETILAIAIKVLNDCTGPSGLCPSLLVFGVLPQLPSSSRRDHPSQVERLRAAETARREYESIVWAERLSMAKKKPAPSATNASFLPGDYAFVYRENQKRYTGPHLVASVHGKHVRIHLGEKTGPRSFNISQLRPANPPNDENVRNITHTEIISQDDPRSSLFDEAKKIEMQGLLSRGAFHIIPRDQAGPNPNIVPARFVLAIKHTNGNTLPRYKARFVIGGHLDRAKNSLVHDTRTVRAESIRLLVTIATWLNLSLSVADWKQGYIQSKSLLDRKIYIDPKELNLPSDVLIQITRPVYGLADAGEYWHDTLSNHLHEHLGFEQSSTDLALWYKRENGELIAIASVYVDDILLAATIDAANEFERISKERFDMSLSTGTSLNYLGLEIETSPDGSRTISQRKQIDRFKLLPTYCSFETFRSARASMAWIQQSRPDVSCTLSFFARITRATFQRNDITAYNKAVHYLRASRYISLNFPRLDRNSLRILCYVDASHANIEDGYSQVGFLIIIADKDNKRSIVCYSSRKSRRVARSTTTGEGLAFGAGFDAAYALRQDLLKLTGRDPPLLMLTDSKILFDIITRRKTTTEKRLMVDLTIARRAYAAREISNIALVSGDDNPADPLTKLKPNKALLKLLVSGHVNHAIKQYIVEPAPPRAYI